MTIPLASFLLTNAHLQVTFFSFQSKCFMFDFYYNKILTGKTFDVDVGMSDTDSFLFKVSNAQNFWNHISNFMDFSNYPITHPDYSNAKQSQLGYFKNELCGNVKCSEFVGLRSKCYSLKIKDDKNVVSEKKVCKGLGRVAIKNRLTFKQYKDSLFKRKIFRHQFASIRSKQHNVATIIQRKKALSYFDSKRHIFSCGIHSSPFGSNLIKKFKDCPFC